MLFPTSPNKWVHLKESTWPHGPITFAKSQWICAVPRKTLANTRFDSNLISDNTFSVLTLQSFTFFCLKTHQTKKKCLHACRTQKEACFHAPCVTQTLPNDEKGLRTRSSRQSIVPSFPLGTARRCHRGTIGGVTPVRLQEMAGLLVSPCDFLPHIRRDVWIGLIRATSFDENGTTCARLQPFKTNTHTHTPITPPITPMCHASLMTSNCGWKMFHNQIENKTRKRWRYYNTVISFPVAKCDISRRNYSWRPAALHHRTLPCNGATHTWTASFPSGRSTNGATQIHGSWFFWTLHKKQTNIWICEQMVVFFFCRVQTFTDCTSRPSATGTWPQDAPALVVCVASYTRFMDCFPCRFCVPAAVLEHTGAKWRFICEWDFFLVSQQSLWQNWAKYAAHLATRSSAH